MAGASDPESAECKPAWQTSIEWLATNPDSAQVPWAGVLSAIACLRKPDTIVQASSISVDDGLTVLQTVEGALDIEPC